MHAMQWDPLTIWQSSFSFLVVFFSAVVHVQEASLVPENPNHGSVSVDNDNNDDES